MASTRSARRPIDAESEAVRAFREWAAQSTAPNEPCISVGTTVLSRRQLAEHVAQGSELGCQMLASLAALAEEFPSLGHRGILERMAAKRADRI